MTKTPPAPHSDELRIRKTFNNLTNELVVDVQEFADNPEQYTKSMQHHVDRLMYEFKHHRPTPAPVGDEGLTIKENKLMDKKQYDNPSNEKLLEAAKPLIQYLAENYHPHVTCIVDATRAEVYEAQQVVNTEEFLRD